MPDRQKLRRFLLAAVILGLVAACSPSGTPDEEGDAQRLERITVQVGWALNGGISPECTAIVKGYYRDQGLDVTLKPGGPIGATFLNSTVALAASQRIDIAIDNDLVSLLEGKTRSADPKEQITSKVFAAFWQDWPLGFIVRADSGLRSLRDFGKRKPNGQKYVIGTAPDAPVLRPLARYAGVEERDLKIIQVGFDATPFITGQVDALLSFRTTQTIQVEKAGIVYRFLPISELPGFSQPTYVAEARPETLRNRPKMLERWLRATIQGARDTIIDPVAAGQRILDPRCGGPAFSAADETNLIRKSIPLYKYKGSFDRIGYVDMAQVQRFSDAYYRLGRISSAPRADELVDLSILKLVYGP